MGRTRCNSRFGHTANGGADEDGASSASSAVGTSLPASPTTPLSTGRPNRYVGLEWKFRFGSTGLNTRDTRDERNKWGNRMGKQVGQIGGRTIYHISMCLSKHIDLIEITEINV